MRDFKFLQFTEKERVFTDWMDAFDDYHLGGIQRRIGNHYCNFNMDIALVNALRWKKEHNQDITTGSDVSLVDIGVPIQNCWMRIVSYRSLPSRTPARTEFDFRIIEVNTYPRSFTSSIITSELMRILDL